MPGARDLFGLLKSTAKDFSDDECPRSAAALSYSTIFALPPLLALLVMIAGALWDPREVQQTLQTQFAGLISADAAQQVGQMIEHVDRPDTGGPVAALIGIGALLFGATGAFLALQGALNRAWEVAPDPEQGGIRKLVLKRLLSVGMILGVAFVLLVSLAVSALLSAFGGALAGYLPEGLSGPALQLLELALSFVVISGLFAAIFRVLPDAHVEWKDALVGGTFTALLFVVGKFAIGFYLGRSDPGSAFGAAGALAVILIWIYYASMILLFGAEFTQQWACRTGRDIVPAPGAVRVRRRLERVEEPDASTSGAPGRRRVASGARTEAWRGAPVVPPPAYAARGTPRRDLWGTGNSEGTAHAGGAARPGRGGLRTLLGGLAVYGVLSLVTRRLSRRATALP